MIRAAVLYLWTVTASLLVGYLGIALTQWAARELRVAHARREINRRDRTEMRRHQAATNVTGNNFWSHP